jgi:hypothetical protein
MASKTKRWVLKMRLRGTIAVLAEYRSALRAHPSNEAELAKIEHRLGVLAGRLQRIS